MREREIDVNEDDTLKHDAVLKEVADKRKMPEASFSIFRITKRVNPGAIYKYYFYTCTNSWLLGCVTFV